MRGTCKSVSRPAAAPKPVGRNGEDREETGREETETDAPERRLEKGRKHEAAAAAAAPHKPIKFLLVSFSLITEFLSSPGTAGGMLPENDSLRCSCNMQESH